MKFVEYAIENAAAAKWVENLGEFTDERGRTYDLVLRRSGGCVAIFPHAGSDVFGETYNVDTDDPWEIRGAILSLVADHHDTIDNPYELENGELSYSE